MVDRSYAHASPRTAPRAFPPNKKTIDPSSFAVNEWWLRAFGPPPVDSLRHASFRAGVAGVELAPVAVGDGVEPPTGSFDEHPAATPIAASDATLMNVRRSDEPCDTREV